MDTREERKGKVRARDKVKAASTSGRGRTRNSHGPHVLEGVCDSYVDTMTTCPLRKQWAPEEKGLLGLEPPPQGVGRGLSVSDPRQVLFSWGGFRDRRVFQRGVAKSVGGKGPWG